VVEAKNLPSGINPPRKPNSLLSSINLAGKR
jgi:hypothetical protein